MVLCEMTLKGQAGSFDGRIWAILGTKDGLQIDS